MDNSIEGLNMCIIEEQIASKFIYITGMLDMMQYVDIAMDLIDLTEVLLDDRESVIN
jgi:hypothetical protein